MKGGITGACEITCEYRRNARDRTEMIYLLENSLISCWNYYSIILLSIPLAKDKKSNK